MPTPLLQFVGDNSLAVEGSLGLSMTNSISSPTYVDGPLGGGEKGLSLVGEQQVLFTATSSLNFSGAFSVGMWVKIPSGSYTSAEQTFWSQGIRTGITATKYGTASWSTRLWGSSSSSAGATSGVVSSNTWAHFWVTSDGSTLRAYKNGTQFGSGSIVSGGFGSSNAWNVGGPGYATTSWLNGYIYDFRIYNSVVSPTDAQAPVTIPAVTISYSKSDVSVYGQSTGSITITPSGGIGTFTYAWNDGPTTQNRSSLPGGSYTVTVTSSTSTASQTVVVGQPLNVTYTKTDVVTYGQSTGAIDVTAAGGIGTYTYSWSDGPTTQDRSSLPAGSYTVTVTSGSYSASQAIVVAQPTPITIVNTPVAARASWLAVAGATYYKVTYQASGGSETTSATGRTVLDVLVSGLAASTAHTIRVYSATSSASSTYTLSYSQTFTTPASTDVNFDKAALATTVSGSTVYDVTSITSTASRNVFLSVLSTVLSTGDSVFLNATSNGALRGVTAKVVKLGEAVSLGSTEGIFLPFTSTGGSSQQATLTLSDNSTVNVSYDESGGDITVGTTVYSPGDVFILDGKKCTIMST